MSYSKPISFTYLNPDIFEDILKYLIFKDLIRFERINSFWKESVNSLLRRRRVDYISFPDMYIFDKVSTNFKMSDWFDLDVHSDPPSLHQATEARCHNLRFISLPYRK